MTLRLLVLPLVAVTLLAMPAAAQEPPRTGAGAQAARLRRRLVTVLVAETLIPAAR